MAEYYKVLEVKRSCKDADLKKAYRQQAIQWHPQRNKGKDAEFIQKKFAEVSEAYCVLIDPKLRAIYDQYHEKGLKRGSPNGNGGFVGGWSFDQNPEQVFSDFFGSSSPFAEFFNPEDGLKLFGDPDAPAPSTKVGSQNAALYFTLEELYSGCTKKTSVVRQRIADGGDAIPEERTLTVEVKPGWREGTKITFKGEGDEAQGLETGDVVFELREQPHPRFRRRKNDLLFTAKVSLREALTGATVEVPTLDGRVLPIPVVSIIRPGYTQVVTGEGMPLARNSSARGNLVIDFEVAFPEELSVPQREALSDILG
jgi:DnaJ-class molecular chaperone